MNAEFLEAVDRWLTWLAHNAGRSEATVSKYRGALLRLGAWYAQPPKDRKLGPIGTDPLHPSMDDLERFAGLYAHSLKLSPRARRPLVSALRGFFTWLASSGGAPGNPAASLPLPKAGRPLPRAASIDVGQRLLMAPNVETFAGLRDAAMIAILLGAAFRVSGLLGLNESALLWYRDDAGLERLVIRVSEKGGRERIVPVANEAAMLLRAYMGHPDLASIPRTLANGDAVLFVSISNRTIAPSDYYGEARRLTRRGLLHLLHGYAERAGVPAAMAHPHALRHLYGAEMTEDDTPLLTLQHLLGHADPKSTEIYSALAHRKLRKAVDQSNPLTKMRSPLLDSLRQLHRATTVAPHASPRPTTAQNPKSAQRERGGKRVF